jgi:hypothetical protein
MSEMETNLFGEEVPKIVRTDELKATHHFVVFYFDDLEDWKIIKKMFKLQKVSSIEGKPKGTRIGRVINGKKLIEKIH